MPRQTYYCPQCNKKHFTTSRIGKEHKKFKTTKKVEKKLVKKTRTKIKKTKKTTNTISCCKNNLSYISHLGSILILLLIGFFVMLSIFCFHQITLDEFDTQTSLTSQIKTRVKQSKYATTSFKDEEKLNIEQADWLPLQAWSADGQKFLYRKNGPETSLGLPEYFDYYVYNIYTQENILTKEKEEILYTTISWQGNEVKEKKDTAEEFVDLTEKNSLVYSDNQEYAAWVETNDAGLLNLYLLKKGQSEENKINLGSLRYGVENSYPDLIFVGNDAYIIADGGQEVFSVELKKAIVSEPPAYQRNLVVFSPNYDKLLVIKNIQDKVDQDDYSHETVSFSVIDLETLVETKIFSSQGNSDEEPYLTFLQATWSPDGEYLIYNYNKHLWLIKADGLEKKQLTTVAKEYSQPRWSSEGRYLVYKIDQELYLVELDVKNLFSKKIKVKKQYSEASILNPIVHADTINTSFLPARR